MICPAIFAESAKGKRMAYSARAKSGVASESTTAFGGGEALFCSMNMAGETGTFALMPLQPTLPSNGNDSTAQLRGFHAGNFTYQAV
jgi:hypothetical protein